MLDLKVLASDPCPPGINCSKVAQRQPGRVAIVGQLITDPEVLAALGVGPGEAAVEINESMYRDGYSGLDEGGGEV